METNASAVIGHVVTRADAEQTTWAFLQLPEGEQITR